MIPTANWNYVVGELDGEVSQILVGDLPGEDCKAYDMRDDMKFDGYKNVRIVPCVTGN